MYVDILPTAEQLPGSGFEPYDFVPQPPLDETLPQPEQLSTAGRWLGGLAMKYEAFADNRPGVATVVETVADFAADRAARAAGERFGIDGGDIGEVTSPVGDFLRQRTQRRGVGHVLVSHTVRYGLESGLRRLVR